MYKVEHKYLSGWGDAEWEEDGVPLRFTTREEAQEAIEEFIQDTEAAYAQGDLPEPYNDDEYRVVETTN